MALYEKHSIPERLEYWVNKHPNSEAFVFIDRDGLRSVLTCQEVLNHAVHFAKQLRKMGLKPGDVVCSLVPDSPNGIIALFGILMAGCVVLNGTLHLTDGSFVRTNLINSQCPALILSSDEDDECRRVFAPHFDFREGHEVMSDTIPNVTKIIFTQDDQLLGFKWTSLDGDPDADTDDSIWTKQHSDAMIALTSGTTGMAKMIVHSHESALMYGQNFKPIMSKSPKGFFNYHSISWVGGFPNYFLATGQKRILIDQRKPPASHEFYKFLHGIFEHEPFDLFFSPISSVLELTEYIKSDPALLRWSSPICYLAGGLPLSKGAVEIVKPYFETMHNLYGSSEANFISNKEIQDCEEFEDFNVGHPSPGTEVKIVDERNISLPQGETGRIKVKTRGMFKKYLGSEKLTEAAFDDEGYFDMEDFGFINKQGEIITYGRSKEVIMRGENYYHPSWIETVIRSCPQIRDVVVVKVPDDRLFHEICACVVLVAESKIDQHGVEKMCKTKFIQDDSSHKSACPRYFIILDKLPLNKNGKPDRNVLEKYAAEKLKLT